ncbi:hypothetical protein RGE_29870 [Rubrivivax gelatinosus IL144]|uniref:Uncharacterized protein n=1 Tax=Rubrivivax gelatinosus (strain NBRC 100245 / IL144) TaxID=983917 RepID=I0HTI9_RUBGI|nr:hypothetical protein RGE_29870 [Rubrivivax gelatinosus IL144]
MQLDARLRNVVNHVFAGGGGCQKTPDVDQILYGAYQAALQPD